MPPEPEPASLLHAQREMARAVRTMAPGSTVPDVFIGSTPLAAPERLAVYRNNARQFFGSTLKLTFPVLHHRVGDDFFRQITEQYRAAHPSRSGDLHWVGAAFPAWLEHRLRLTEYAWLADLARLEWACEEASAASAEPALPLQALGVIAPDAMDSARLQLQSSLRLVESPWPIWSVWHSNQSGSAGPPIDLTTGPERCVCACTDDRVVVYRLDPPDFAVLAALHEGATFAEALVPAQASPEVLVRVLDWGFGAGLVAAVNPSARA